MMNGRTTSPIGEAEQRPLRPNYDLDNYCSGKHNTLAAQRSS